jgi:hypothetical protein
VGTRLAACPEALTGDGSRRALIAARATDTAVTRVFDVAKGLPWPARFPSRVLANDFVARWPWIDNLVPGTADQCMYLVGVIEIVAGVLVAVAPRIGAWVVAAWLVGIITDLVTGPGFYDVALRDFGLLVAAIALGRLAQGVHNGSIGSR